MSPIFHRSGAPSERDVPEDEAPGARMRPPGRRSREWDAAAAVDELLRGGSATFRRRMIVYVLGAVLSLAAISVALAWLQYNDAKSQALNDLDARVVAVSALVDTSFGGKIATLDTIASIPAVVDQQTAQMSAYFKRVDPAGSPLFSGGLGWSDRQGLVRASNRSGSVIDISSRLYFQQALATSRPYVSDGLIGRRVKQPIIVVAVPTYDRQGQVSGVLAGGILVKSVGENEQALDLGFGNLRIIDRSGQLLLSHLPRIANKPLLSRIERTGSGVLASTRGLNGKGDDVVAYATSKLAGWVTVIDRPRSSVFAAAQHALILELVSVGAGVLLVLSLLVFVVRRSRRDSEEQEARTRSWGGLTRSLASAATPSEVADALLAALAAAFTDSVAAVAFESGPGALIRARSQLPQGRSLRESRASLEAIAELGKEGAKSTLIEHEPTLAPVVAAAGRRFKALHSVPILGKGNEPVGTIALLNAETRLEPSDWALLGSFADQAVHALERALLYAHEHELAVRLQRSLLPDRLPTADGVELAGHYLAGGDAVEVGGDWYDAVRRPDGIIQLCVGDVSGKGIGAATVMGRQRNTFHVYAHDYVSPAEIIRRMLPHVNDDDMITVACVSVDPYAGQVTYACAGHPPPLLLDRDTGKVIRLDRASAPPIGVAEPGEIVESQLQLPGRSVLAMYTDGLIERRGESIDDGIDVLGQVIAAEENVTTDAVVREVSRLIGAPVDDVALLVMTLDVERTGFKLEVPAEPASLPSMRRHLRALLARRQFDGEQTADIVLAVSEACNNAIEHAYPDGEGTIKVSVEDGSETFRIVVEDQGRWRVRVPDDERGRGITLMKQLMHSAEIETTAQGTRVTLELGTRRDREKAPEYAPTNPRR